MPLSREVLAGRAWKWFNGIGSGFRGALMQWGDEMEELFRIFASLSIVYDIAVFLFALS